MPSILDYFKFKSIQKEDSLRKNAIFCFDYAQGIAMFQIMLLVCFVISFQKPFSVQGTIFYAEVIFLPLVLHITQLTYRVYQDSVAKNISFFSIIILIAFGVFGKLVSMSPASAYFNRQEGFNFVFSNAMTLCLLLALVLFVTNSLLINLNIFINKNITKCKSYYRIFCFLITT